MSDDPSRDRDLLRFLLERIEVNTRHAETETIDQLRFVVANIRITAAQIAKAIAEDVKSD